MFGFEIVKSKESCHQSGTYYAGERHHYYFNWISNEHPLNDGFILETADAIWGFDGVLLNKRELLNQHAASQFPQLLRRLHSETSNFFLSTLRGEFCGFYFDKQSEKVSLYTNQTSTKKVYYHQKGEEFFSAPSIRQLLPYLQKKELNIEAAYSLLTLGGTFEGATLIKDVSRLEAGSYLEITNQFKKTIYCDLKNIAYEDQNFKTSISTLHDCFERALQRNYEKDVEITDQHFTTLSGGLDSRMTAFTAHKLGYTDHQFFCFSQKNYADETIARQIANDLKSEFLFTDLSSGAYMKDLEVNTDYYDASVFYLSSAHFNYSLNQHRQQQFDGLIHTGQIGGMVLGGFLSNNPEEASNSSILLSSKLAHRLDFLPKLGEDYGSEESFKLYNRSFNIINSGSWVCESRSFLVSPFMDPDFLAIALALPRKFKQHYRIYFEWIKEKLPAALKYRWDKTMLKPVGTWTYKIAPYRMKALKLRKLVQGNKAQWSMNPYDYWMTNQEGLNSFYQTSFQNNLHLLDAYPTLKKDVEKLYKEGNAVEKSMVLTLLNGMKQYNIS